MFQLGRRLLTIYEKHKEQKQNQMTYTEVFILYLVHGVGVKQIQDYIMCMLGIIQLQTMLQHQICF